MQTPGGESATSFSLWITRAKLSCKAQSPGFTIFAQLLMTTRKSRLHCSTSPETSSARSLRLERPGAGASKCNVDKINQASETWLAQGSPATVELFLFEKIGGF